MSTSSSRQSFQFLGLLLTIVFFVISLYICIYPGWRRNDPQRDILENIIRVQGLWFQCTILTTGSWQCDDYDTFFISLPAVIQGSRGFTIFSIIASFISLCLFLPGGRCTVYYIEQPNMKARLAGMAATLVGIGAFCCLIAASWYAAEVVSAYWMQTMPNSLSNTSGNFNYNDRFIYGRCIYLGWANFVVGLTASVLTCCGARQSEEEMEYGADQERAGQGYIPNQPPAAVRSFHNKQFIPSVVHSNVPKALKPYYNAEPEVPSIMSHSQIDFGHVNPNFRGPRRPVQEYV